jgi:hypothetical protein
VVNVNHHVAGKEMCVGFFPVVGFLRRNTICGARFSVSPSRLAPVGASLVEIHSPAT